MNASPAMEAGGPLMVFGATVSLRSAAGERRIPVAELATGPGKTVAAPDELLTEVEIPLPPEGTGSAYARLGTGVMLEIAVVGATVAVTVVDGSVESAAVAITALAPTIRLVPEAADALVGTDGGGEARDRGACGGRRGRADLRRRGLRRLPPGDDRGAGAARRRSGGRAGPRRDHPGATTRAWFQGSRTLKLPLAVTVNGSPTASRFRPRRRS